MSAHGMTDLEVVIKALREEAYELLQCEADYWPVSHAFSDFARRLQSILDANKPTVQPEQDEQEERK